jgi:methylated-DNA-[protein]-cysteine S-methyltransferase
MSHSLIALSNAPGKAKASCGTCIAYMHLTTLTLDVPTCLVVDSPVGQLRLEASADGLVALSWTHLLANTLPVRSASPEIDRAHRFLRQGAAWLRAYFSGRSTLPPLPPLAPAGTAFQKAVWRQVVHIRPGTTTSYGEIARALRMPGASRAVGQAVGANPLPVLIPCHRVLAAGGRLGGYSSGLRRKRWLLAHEGLERIG